MGDADRGHVANRSDAALLQRLYDGARAFLAMSLVTLSNTRDDVLRGVVRVVINLQPFEMVAFVDDTAIATADANATLGPIVATIFENGLRSLPPQTQRLIANLIADGRATPRLVVVLGQERPHVDGIVTSEHGHHERLFTITTVDADQIAH